MSGRPGTRIRVCPEPECPELVENGVSACDHPRPGGQQASASERGYDHNWRKNAKAFLAEHPTCVDCGGPATVPDHDPITRQELLEMGVPDPDAWHRLQPRCGPCHKRKSAKYDGALGNPKKRRRRGGPQD